MLSKHTCQEDSCWSQLPCVYAAVKVVDSSLTALQVQVAQAAGQLCASAGVDVSSRYPPAVRAALGLTAAAPAPAPGPSAGLAPASAPLPSASSTSRRLLA